MKDKIIVITGASEGLGRCVAGKLAGQGATVVLVAHEADKLQRAAMEIGANARSYTCDISSSEQIRRVIGEIWSDFGRIDILINNAGVWTDEEIEKNNPAQRRKVLEVNALGTIEVTKTLEPYFRKQDRGHILNVISTSGTVDTSSGDNTRWQTYGASKWALAGFTRAFKDSLEGTGVKVTGFYPGGFESSLYEAANRPDAHDQPWMMRTEDVADALIFCLTRPDDVLVEKMVVTKFRNA
ncbi:MAG TPA: SDR family NAD(P)-dependent oxidoreductase [Candidatus Saccharimonadales bacterium]